MSPEPSSSSNGQIFYFFLNISKVKKRSSHVTFADKISRKKNNNLSLVVSVPAISETTSHNYPSLIVSVLATDGSLTTTVFCVSKIDLSDVWNGGTPCWKSLREG